MRRFWSRRDFLFQSCGGNKRPGAGSRCSTRTDMLAATVNDAACDSKPVGFNPFAAKKPHFPPAPPASSRYS